jgi:hypothetical protein
MIVLFYTDVILDLVLDRKPFSEAAVQLFSKVEEDEISGFVGATTITTIHYLATKTIGAKKTKSAIRALLSILDVASVDRPVLERALEGKYEDFEDGVLGEFGRQMRFISGPRQIGKTTITILTISISIGISAKFATALFMIPIFLRHRSTTPRPRQNPSGLFWMRSTRCRNGKTF